MMNKLFYSLFVLATIVSAQSLTEFDSTKFNFLVPMDGIYHDLSKIPHHDWKALIIDHNKTVLNNVQIELNSQEGPELGSAHIGFKGMIENDSNVTPILLLLHYKLKGNPKTCYYDKDFNTSFRSTIDTLLILGENKYHLFNSVYKKTDSTVIEVSLSLNNKKQFLISDISQYKVESAEASILWAGDIDMDNLMDILLYRHVTDCSWGYELWLSTLRKDNLTGLLSKYRRNCD